MALHFVAYRLKNDPSYPVRYKSLIDALEALTATKWTEETSLVVLLYQSTPQALHAHLMNNSKLYRNGDDMLVVVEFEPRGREAIGVKKLALLDSIFAFAQKPKAAGLMALGASVQPKGRNALGS